MSLWCITKERAYPFVFVPRVFKGLVPGVQLIYCRDIEDLVRFAGPLGRYLALRGKLVISIDSNGPIAGLIGKYIEGKSPRFFKGPAPPRLGDISYTQAAMFPWPWPAGVSRSAGAASLKIRTGSDKALNCAKLDARPMKFDAATR